MSNEKKILIIFRKETIDSNNLLITKPIKKTKSVPSWWPETFGTTMLTTLCDSVFFSSKKYMEFFIKKMKRDSCLKYNTIKNQNWAERK